MNSPFTKRWCINYQYFKAKITSQNSIGFLTIVIRIGDFSQLSISYRKLHGLQDQSLGCFLRNN